VHLDGAGGLLEGLLEGGEVLEEPRVEAPVERDVEVALAVLEPGGRVPARPLSLNDRISIARPEKASASGPSF
jgi:hypothetical protein